MTEDRKSLIERIGTKEDGKFQLYDLDELGKLMHISTINKVGIA